MDLRDLIQNRLDKAEAERDEQKRVAAMPVYNVVYSCGHVQTVRYGDDLYKRCEARIQAGFIDALPLNYRCPTCVQRGENQLRFWQLLGSAAKEFDTLEDRQARLDFYESLGESTVRRLQDEGKR